MDKVVDMAVDERFMREALREAMAAEAEDEIPIGAVSDVCCGVCVGSGGQNRLWCC